MKKIIAAALSALILLLGGCQTTPEKGVVASKNDGAFESALEGTPAPAEDPAASAAEPVIYEDTFSGEQADATFHIRVAEPAVDTAMPVLRVRPLELTGDMARRVAQALFPGAEIYEYTGQMTREEAEQALLEEKQAYADWQYQIEADPIRDADDREYVRAAYEQRIAELEQVYASAPESVERKLCDWQMREDPEDGSRFISAEAQADGGRWQLYTTSYLGEDYKIQRTGAFPEYDSQEQAPQRKPLTGEAAQAANARALALVEQMDIGPFAPAEDVTRLASWQDLGSQVLLTPVYGGVPLTYHMGGFNPAAKASDDYATNYGYEDIVIAFDGDRVEEFSWENMHQVVETVNENVSLLPFEDVLAAAEDQMRLIDPNYIGSFLEGAALSVEVEDVILGLSRIRMKDSATDYYLTPTYTFYGAITSCDENGQPIQFPVYDDAGNETGQTTTNTQYRELAVINAVDGTAIDVGKGY